MKRLLAVLAVGLMLPLAAGPGCAPWIKATKEDASRKQSPGAQMGDAAAGGKRAKEPAEEGAPRKLSPEELEKMLPPPPPSLKGESGEGKRALPASPKELLEKEEINASALEFAKGIPNVKHVKTCFSKMFGGWYLHLYTPKGKKMGLLHYTWNSVTREWDVSMAVKDLPLENLEHHLKGEVGDEQCTVLK
ncbi:MAG: hypothetical protein V1792_18630 [Pseudomonadota bacterium]